MTDGRFDTQLAGSTSASRFLDIAAGTAIGEYVVEAKIGEGGMGSVYAVTHPLIGKHAAIKVMAPHLCNDAIAVERFILEARSVNQIGHPNIVDVFAFGKLPDGRSYFIMEWLHGESLATRIARSGPLPLREAADLIVQIADALEAAHEKEVVHRDLKPDNVFLVPVRGRRLVVKLLDFGIAKLVGAQLETRKTRTGTFVGTPAYTPPEQARGLQVQPQGDIYALGVTAYEMMTGRLPFDADNPFEIIHQHLYAPSPSPQLLRPELPEIIDGLIRMMMAKDPQERPSLDMVTEVVSEWRDEMRKEARNTPLGVPVRSPRELTPVPISLTPAPMVTMSEAATATLLGAATPPPLEAADAPAGPRSTAAPWPATNTPSVAVEILPVAPSKRGRVVAIVAACAVAGVIGIVVMLRGSSLPNPSVTPPPKPAVLVVRETVTPAPPPSPPPTPSPSAAPSPAPAPAPSALHVRANVPNADFAVDGKPLAQATATLRVELDAEGPHRLSVSAPKRQPYVMTVFLRRGELVEVNAKLRPMVAGGNAEPKSESKNYVLDPFRH